jgi:hypothetical protein
LVTLTDTDNLQTWMDRKNHCWSISNAEYQERSSSKRNQQLELQAREIRMMQPIYDYIRSPKTNNLAEFEDYVRSISVVSRQ